jgi:RNA polymerase sigma-70 factor (sigma-E family)
MGWFHSRDQYEEEFEAFVACSARSLLRTGYLMTGDLEGAEDLVQESFAKVAQRWQKVRRMQAPTAYARRILINLARDDRRRATRQPLLLEASPEGRVDDTAATLARSDELMRGLARLSPRQRVTVVLRFYEDMPEAEVAEALGCSVGTVKTQTSRALNHLRGFLDEQAGGGNYDVKAETREMIK